MPQSASPNSSPHPAAPHSASAGLDRVALRAGVLVIWLEVQACLVLVGGLVREVVIGQAQQRSSTLALAGFALLLAGGLAWGALAVWRERRAARGPLVTWQLLQLVVGINFLAEPHSPLIRTGLVAAVVVAVLGIATLGFLAARTAQR